jgi:hypothetical protein
MNFQLCKASMALSMNEECRNRPIPLIFGVSPPILVVMLNVLNILASARRSGCLAADVISAS